MRVTYSQRHMVVALDTEVGKPKYNKQFTLTVHTGINLQLQIAVDVSLMCCGCKIKRFCYYFISNIRPR